jgi:hypothetical protein
MMKSEDLSFGPSRFDSDINMPNRISTPEPHTLFADGCKRETPHEEGNVDKEQPYAQLIYRALMEADGHTMVLRDIYSWFKRNTDKAMDKETKGWQNSIRHNLSMNAVSYFRSSSSTPKLTFPGLRKGGSTSWRGNQERVRVETHRKRNSGRGQKHHQIQK